MEVIMSVNYHYNLFLNVNSLTLRFMNTLWTQGVIIKWTCLITAFWVIVTRLKPAVKLLSIANLGLLSALFFWEVVFYRQAIICPDSLELVEREFLSILWAQVPLLIIFAAGLLTYVFFEERNGHTNGQASPESDVEKSFYICKLKPKHHA